MFENEQKSQFQSDLFKFRSKKANRIASYCFVSCLGIGFLTGSVVFFVSSSGGLWNWCKFHGFGASLGGLFGLALGFGIGSRIEAAYRKRKKGKKS